jgi:microcin C transport system permease protein
MFAAILTLSLSANLLANDRPLLLSYNGQLYLPIFQTIPETTFGAENFLPTETDYTNPAIRTAIAAHGWALWPPIPYSYDTVVWSAPPPPAPPSWQNWLGTDDVSRDVLARTLYGLRLSILFGLCLTAAAAALGIAAGALQGYYGGWTDLGLQRFTEIWSGIPRLFLLIIIASIIPPNFALLLLFLLIFSWMPLAGLVRAEFYRARAADYVRAARALGLADWQIVTRHILPNALTATLTFLPFMLADSVTLLASLDFLGFGLPPTSPSLGQLVAEAKNNIFAPWLACTAFVSLGGILLLLIFIGEAARDAFDPNA